jgi:membrane-associated phospholipid phosphatase
VIDSRCRTALNASRLIAALAGASMIANAWAGAGPLGIDHELAFDQSGIWARRNQQALEYGVIGFELIGALWLGNDDEFGHSLWQSVDASSVSAVGAAGLKLGFGRARPNAGQGPNKWFEGRSNQSFPSGEVTLQASFVTPLIVNYAERNPWVWSLEVLPLYDGIARMKSQAHWQTDVLAGWALGSAAGYWATRRDIPISVQVLPRGVSLGYSKRF